MILATAKGRGQDHAEEVLRFFAVSGEARHP
jgi:hypothetical protein